MNLRGRQPPAAVLASHLCCAVSRCSPCAREFVPSARCVSVHVLPSLGCGRTDSETLHGGSPPPVRLWSFVSCALCAACAVGRVPKRHCGCAALPLIGGAFGISCQMRRRSCQPARQPSRRGAHPPAQRLQCSRLARRVNRQGQRLHAAALALVSAPRAEPSLGAARLCALVLCVVACVCLVCVRRCVCARLCPCVRVRAVRSRVRRCPTCCPRWAVGVPTRRRCSGGSPPPVRLWSFVSCAVCAACTARRMPKRHCGPA